MVLYPKLGFVLFAATSLTTTLALNNTFNVKPFTIDLSGGIERLNLLVNNTRLPAAPLYPGAGITKGVELDFLSGLRTEWLESFDWETQQAQLNQSVPLISPMSVKSYLATRFEQFTVEIEGLTVHYVHEKSTDPNAIPLILLHGWPGNFMTWRLGINITINGRRRILRGVCASDQAIDSVLDRAYWTKRFLQCCGSIPPGIPLFLCSA